MVATVLARCPRHQAHPCRFHRSIHRCAACAAVCRFNEVLLRPHDVGVHVILVDPGVFSITYLGLALGKVPGLRTDRAGIALAGAAAILACGQLSFEEAVKAVDFATILLLLGMMIVVAFLRRAGFFEVLTRFALDRFRRPVVLLAVIMLLSGVLSALLVNDVVCLALTPLTLHLARHLDLNPKPHLIGLAVASNIGSAATLTGNPQNMIIGGLSHISYHRRPAVFVDSLGRILSIVAHGWHVRPMLAPCLRAGGASDGRLHATGDWRGPVQSNRSAPPG